MEKTKNGYDLKVARIVSISSAENTVCSVEELHILLISISVGSQQRTFFIVYMSLRCPIKQRNRLHRVYVQVVSPFLYYNRVWVLYNPHPHCPVNQYHVFLLIGRTSIMSRATLSRARASSSVSAYSLRHASACSDLWSAEHSGGEITLARVGQESNYRLVVQLLATGKLSRSPCRCTRRYACEQTFAARQQTCG